VFKRIGVLSGGERNRYALLKMLLHPANFLLLDEPTNHLDLRAKDVLLEALMKYTGTVVFVSHDRYFIDKLASRVFEIGEGKVEIYPGNYEDYLWRKQGRATVAVEIPKPSISSSGSSSVPMNGDRAPAAEAAEAKAKRLNPIKRQQMEDRLHEVEEEIARAEAAIALCETELQSFVSAEETQRQTQELARRKSDLLGLMKEWEELSGTLETMG
jgi:ATP-binding cassette subfamily F protein 3